MNMQQRPGAYFDIDGTVFKSSFLEKVIAEGIEQGIFTDEVFEEAADLKR